MCGRFHQSTAAADIARDGLLERGVQDGCQADAGTLELLLYDAARIGGIALRQLHRRAVRVENVRRVDDVLRDLVPLVRPIRRLAARPSDAVRGRDLLREPPRETLPIIALSVDDVGVPDMMQVLGVPVE